MKNKKMKLINAALLIALVCFVGGCSGKKSLSSTVQYRSMERIAAPGQSEIIVVNRTHSNFTVFINGHERLKLGSQKNETIVVPNGRHTIYVKRGWGGFSGVQYADLEGARIVLAGYNTQSFYQWLLSAWMLSSVFFPNDPQGIQLTRAGAYPLKKSDIVAIPNQQVRIEPPPPLPSLPLSVQSDLPKESLPGGIDGAIKKAGLSLIQILPRNARLAVVNVTENDNAAHVVLDELEYMIVTSRRYDMIYRGTYEHLRKERALKISGDITDNNLLGLGHITGANVVIAASVTAVGDSNKITLRALDVKSTRTIAMAREAY